MELGVQVMAVRSVSIIPKYLNHLAKLRTLTSKNCRVPIGQYSTAAEQCSGSHGDGPTDKEGHSVAGVRLLEAQVIKLEEQVRDLTEKYKQALADSDTVRRRTQKFVEDAKLFGIQSFCRDLVEVADLLQLVTREVEGEGAGAGLGEGLDQGAGPGEGTGAGLDQGAGEGEGLNQEAETGMGADQGVGTGEAVGQKAWPGPDQGAGQGEGLDQGAGLGQGAGTGTDQGARLDQGADRRPQGRGQRLAHLQDRLQGVFSKHGLEKIRAVGERYDPFLHEVVCHTAADGAPPGTVTLVTQDGYKLHGRTIRHAHVGIAMKMQDR